MNSGPLTGMDMEWLPVVGATWLWLLCVLALIAVSVAVWRRAWGLGARVLLYGLLVLLLVQPMVRQDERKALPDKVLVVVDDSASQKIAQRDVAATAALKHVEDSIAAMAPDVEAVVVRAPQYSDVRKGEATHVFSLLREQMLGLPLSQMAGTILITDGQVHDAPENAKALGALSRLAPVHVVLTGRRDEFDRKVAVVSAPRYGLINQTVTVTVRVDEVGGGASGAPLDLTVWQDGVQQQQRTVLAGEDTVFTLPLAHPGQNVFEFRTPVAEGEMTAGNNMAPVIVNAVRDRLRVLLVSGVPHMGERAWRNLLKSDPGIDLVHFTILRPPTAMDMTPPNEMSLIVFPVDELFNTRIDDFDLIIFDKYQQFNLMPDEYFANIRHFIRNGGAFLLAMGSDTVEDSVLQSALADTLPVTAVGRDVLTTAYRPALSKTGEVHPVTADLPRRGQWGEWLTQARVGVAGGKVLMTGNGDAPLLVINEVEKGRVAALSSDNIWLWSKGGRNAGPYGEVLRNLSHWLMKEPELEEGYLKAEARGRAITVSRRQAGGADKPVVELSLPSGERRDLTLATVRGNWDEATFEAEENGIYTVTHGDKKAFVVVGTAQSEEYADVLTTSDRLAATTTATRGGVIWAQDTPDFTLRRVASDARTLAGDGWLGLRRSEAYAVTAVSASTVFGNELFLALALLGIIGVWIFESGRWRRR